MPSGTQLMTFNRSWLYQMFDIQIPTTSKSSTYSLVPFLCHNMFHRWQFLISDSLLFRSVGGWMLFIHAEVFAKRVIDTFLWAFSIQQYLPKLWSIRREETPNSKSSNEAALPRDESNCSIAVIPMEDKLLVGLHELTTTITVILLTDRMLFFLRFASILMIYCCRYSSRESL